MDHWTVTDWVFLLPHIYFCNYFVFHRAREREVKHITRRGWSAMKWMFVLIVLVGVALFFKNRQTTPPSPLVLTTPTPVSTPAPVVKHLAPEGIYFLLSRVSIPTDVGISGINVGTRVRFLKNTGPNWLVTDEQTTFEVPPDQPTIWMWRTRHIWRTARHRSPFPKISEERRKRTKRRAWRKYRARMRKQKRSRQLTPPPLLRPGQIHWTSLHIIITKAIIPIGKLLNTNKEWKLTAGPFVQGMEFLPYITARGFPFYPSPISPMRGIFQR